MHKCPYNKFSWILFFILCPYLAVGLLPTTGEAGLPYRNSDEARYQGISYQQKISNLTEAPVAMGAKRIISVYLEKHQEPLRLLLLGLVFLFMAAGLKKNRLYRMCSKFSGRLIQINRTYTNFVWQYHGKHKATKIN